MMGIAISNLRYADPTNTLIDMDVSIDGGESFPFTLSHSDPEPVAEAVWAAMAEGTYEVAPYVPAPMPVPDISDRQFAHELRARAIITQAEALAYVGSGTLPAALAALVAALPEAERDDAELLLAGATVFKRSHPLSAGIGAAFGWSPGEIDDFFRAAAAR